LSGTAGSVLPLNSYWSDAEMCCVVVTRVCCVVQLGQCCLSTVTGVTLIHLVSSQSTVDVAMTTTVRPPGLAWWSGLFYQTAVHDSSQTRSAYLA